VEGYFRFGQRHGRQVFDGECQQTDGCQGSVETRMDDSGVTQVAKQAAQHGEFSEYRECEQEDQGGKGKTKTAYAKGKIFGGCRLHGIHTLSVPHHFNI
jgi:hypothetical protein